MSAQRILNPAVVMLLLGLGCGEQRPTLYPVAGIAKFSDGQPVRLGLVEFIPTTSGPTARGQLTSDGEFKLRTYAPDDGALPGAYRVVITQAVPAPIERVKTPPDHLAHGSTIVPRRYGAIESTPLTATVEAKQLNRVELVVERSPAKK
jgi:hypothetical protein